MRKTFFAIMFAALFSPQLLAQCAIPQPDGTLIFTTDTANDCTAYWLLPSADYAAYLTAVEITALDITTAFTWGFGTIVFFSFLAFKVQIGTALVRKI